MMAVAVVALPPLGLRALAKRSPTSASRVGLVELAAEFQMVGRVHALLDAGATPSFGLLDQAVRWGERDLVVRLAGDGETLQHSLDLPVRGDVPDELAFLTSVGLQLPCEISPSLAEGVARHGEAFDAADVPAACQLVAARVLSADRLEALLERMDAASVEPPFQSYTALMDRFAADGSFERAAALTARWGPPGNTSALRLALQHGDLAWAQSFLERWGTPGTQGRHFTDARRELRNAAARCGPEGLALIARYGEAIEPPSGVDLLSLISSRLGKETPDWRHPTLRDPLEGLLAFPLPEPDPEELVAWLAQGTPTQRVILLERGQPDEAALLALVEDDPAGVAGIVEAGVAPTDGLMDAAVTFAHRDLAGVLIRTGLNAEDAHWHRWVCTLHDPVFWIEQGVTLSEAPCEVGGVPNVVVTAGHDDEALRALREHGIDVDGAPGAVAVAHLLDEIEASQVSMFYLAEDSIWEIEDALASGLPFTEALGLALAKACAEEPLEGLSGDPLPESAWQAVQRTARQRGCGRDFQRAVKAVRATPASGGAQ